MSSFVEEKTPLLGNKSQSEQCIPMDIVTTTSYSAPVTTSQAPVAPKERLASLDQFRGFVVLSLITVPLVGRLDAAPDVFKHKNTFFSLADAIMPQFYVAVGFAMQLTLLHLRATKGMRTVIIKQLRRTRTLYLISLICYGLDNQKTWAHVRDNWDRLLLQPIWSMELFQTLNIIGLTQLFILPVITRPVWVRLCYMCGSMAIYLIFQWTFLMKIQWKQVIEGGSLGPFSWAFPMLAGSLLHDWNEWIRKVPVNNAIARRRRVIQACIGLLFVAGICWLLGYLVSCMPISWSPVCLKGGAVIQCPNMSHPSIPFVPPKDDIVSMWTMSHRLSSLSIRLVSLGYALVMFFIWFVVSDIYNYQFSFLNTLSLYALLIYLLHPFGFRLASCVVPNDSPLYMLPVLLVIGVSANIMIIQYLKSNNINLHL